MQISGKLARAARALVEWPRDHVARLAGIDTPMLADFEAGRADPGDDAKARLRLILEQGGAVFLPEDGEQGAGVRLKFTARDVRAINRMEGGGARWALTTSDPAVAGSIATAHMDCMNPIDALGLSFPLIQAPMAGVSTPAMAAAVSNAGALGSIAVGATDAAGARAMIAATRALTDRPFNVNLFAHAPPRVRPAEEQAWLAALAPLFAAQDAAPPTRLETIYHSFAQDPAMLDLLVEARPRVISFHFGLPGAAQIAALKQAGCLLLASVTNLDEAVAARTAGINVLVAQGFEAGGHRGMFDPDAPDAMLGTFALTRLLVAKAGLPVIAAGGIMDGRGVRAALDLGAVAAQLGTAFIACPESSADAAYRAALASPAAQHTVMTRAISGRPARCLANRFTQWGAENGDDVPDYPRTYAAGKALNAAAKIQGEGGYGAQWAGQGAPLARVLPAADLIAAIAEEMREA